jgi:hypothetical protein
MGLFTCWSTTSLGHIFPCYRPTFSTMHEVQGFPLISTQNNSHPQLITELNLGQYELS